MNVTVNMTDKEFKEFLNWKEDKSCYQEKLDEVEIIAKKVCWAIEPDQKREGKVKIADQEHAAELLEMAQDFLV